MILNETTKRLINDGDINGLKYLFYNTNKKFLDILNQNILSDAEVDKFIENLLVIWQSIIEECKRVNTRIFFGIIWEGYRSFYEYAAKNKIDLRQYKKLLFYTFDFIDILFETNQQKCLLNGIQLLSSSFKTQLTNKNFPKEDEINRFYLENNILTIEDETNSDLNWKYLINILYCKEYLLSKAISLNKKNLVEYSFRYFNHLFYDIAESNKYHLGEKQEAHIVTTILFLIIDNKKNILNSKTGDEPQLFLMHSDLIISLIDKKKKYSKRIIEMYTEYLIFCQGNESINLTYFNFLIENWGDLCKKLAERFNHNNDYDKYILDVLGGLFNLKREIEREFLILKLSNYQTLKKVLSSIERVYRNNWYNQNKSKIESQINSNKSPDKIAEELAAKECLICSLIKNKIASFKHIEE